MELPGSNYLLNLAVISITFVSFSTIVVVLRQALGADLSAFHLLLVRLFVESGLEAAAFSLLPPLLGLLGLPLSTIWRLSSGILAAGTILLLAAYVRQRRRIQPGPLPLRIYINYTISIAVNVGLWMNAVGLPFDPSIGPYALAVTWILIQAGLVFVQTLDVFLQRAPQ